ncbi:MAG: tRNA (adenosine(37)-N6)-threonylcarbamoyltransferase complex transferase subunit TsaD [Candidatus Roizmanbacteria bacterium]|nr:MAG: tRNA (adenosine(37)-N6)-threonylcarbamoyltransferase complex transferase subunit TsaD [Candidatus Roizmanbacteria bacterium]
MKILAIDTSCDETSAAVVDGRRVLSNVIYSQVLLHKKWGGVVPSIAKRAHEERIDFVVDEALKKSKFQISNVKHSFDICHLDFDIKNSMSKIDYLAVTYGPGLAVALEVGIKKVKELSKKYNKKIIPVNHMEGHIYSCFTQNSKGNPKREFTFPYLVLLVSGGHTEIVLWKDYLDFQIIGKTTDDAAGEALDKAAKMLGLGYPGGPVIERLAEEAGNVDPYKFPRPMRKSGDLNFSFSGLKTAFYYFLQKMPEEEKNKMIKELVSSFQEAVFDSLLIKTEAAIKQIGIINLVVAGGVAANRELRKRMKNLAKKYKGSVVYPPYKYLNGDNAAMIGVAAFFKAKAGIFVKHIEAFDRIPRLSL